MAEKIFRMEKFDIMTPMRFSPSLYAFLVLVFVPILALFSQSKRQKILPNIPIIGVDSTKQLAQARNRFRHGSKAMLLEGYQKVSFALMSIYIN